MAIISNSTTIADAGAFSVNLGSQVLIKTITASSDSTISFVDGASSVVFDNTYPIYKFNFINVHPSSDSNRFYFQGSTDTGSSYGLTITSTFFKAFHAEADNSEGVSYDGQNDLQQSTNFQQLNLDADLGADSDQGLSGSLFIFNPSSTTFVKHFIGTTNFSHIGDYSIECFIGGYFNTTSAIDAIQFKMANNNIESGVIKLYGIKDS